MRGTVNTFFRGSIPLDTLLLIIILPKVQRATSENIIFLRIIIYSLFLKKTGRIQRAGKCKILIY